MAQINFKTVQLTGEKIEVKPKNRKNCFLFLNVNKYFLLLILKNLFNVAKRPLCSLFFDKKKKKKKTMFFITNKAKRLKDCKNKSNEQQLYFMGDIQIFSFELQHM